MKTELLTLLVIDDNADNLIGIKALIQDAFPDSKVLTANNGLLGIDLAYMNDADVVLLALQMKGTDSFDLCKTLKADAALKEIPVIFLTDLNVDRENRKRALEAGADAFLPKPVDESELKAQVVAMAKIKNANRNIANEQEQELGGRRKPGEVLSTNQMMLNLILDTIPQSVFLKDKQGKYLGCNRVFAIAAGLNDPAEIVGKTDFDLPWPKHEAESYRADDKEVITSKISKRHIIEPLQQADGTRLWIDTTKIPLLDNSGKPFAMLGIFDDITEQRKAEELLRISEERYSLINNSSRDSIFSYDTSGRFTSANRSLCELLHLKHEQIIGHTHAELGFPEEICKEWDALHHQVYQTNNTVFSETRAPMPDGNMHYFEVMLNPLHDIDGNIIGIGGTTRDIDEKKRIEKEKELLFEKEKTSRQELNTLLERISDGFVAFDSQMNYTFVNEVGARLLGRTANDLIGKNYWTEFPEAKNTPFANAYLQAFETQKPVSIEEYYEPWDRWFSNSIHPSSNGISIIFQEITERKRSEKELQENEKKFRSYVENAPDGVLVVNEKGEYLEVNTAAEKITGYSRDELIGTNILNIIYPEDLPLATQHFNKVVTTGEATEDVRFIHKNGEIRYWTVKAVKLAENRLIGFVSDITERIHTEEALRESERKLNEAQKIAKIGNWNLDLVNNKLHWSDEIYRIFEIDRTVFEANYDAFLETIHPEDREKVNDAYTLSLETKAPYSIEHRLLTKSGTLKWVLENCITHYDDSGNPLKSVGIVQDITDRKLAGEQIDELRNHHQSLFENSLVGTGLATPDGKIIDCNEAFASLLGYARNELINLNVTSFYLSPDERKSVREILIQKDALKDYETKLRRKDGTFITVLINISVVKLQGDIFFQTTCLDITERKRTEEQLLRSERSLSESQRIAHLGSWNLDLATNEVMWTEELYKMYGFDPTLPPPPYTEHMKLFTQESWELLSTSLAKTRETGIPYELELETVRKDGSRGWMWVRGETTKDSNGNTTGLWGAAQDITERKQIESDLKLNKERYRIVSERTSDFTFSCLKEKGGYRLDWMAGAVEKVTGYSVEHLLENKCWRFMVIPDDDTLFVKNVLSLHPGESSKCELRILDSTGKLKWLAVDTVCIVNRDMNKISIYGGCVDITARKLVEENLLKSEERYRSLLTNLGVGVVVHAPDTTIINYNAKALEILGLSDDQMSGKQAFDPQWKFIDDSGNDLPFEMYPVNRVAANCFTFKDQIMGIKRDSDSTTAWVTINGMPVMDTNDQLSEIVISFIDITERRSAEEALRDRDIQFSKLASQVPGMVYQFLLRKDGTFCVPFTSEGITDVFGCTPQEVKDDFSPIAKVILPEDLKLLISSITDSARNLTPWQCEYRVQQPGKPIRWMYGQSMPEKLKEGEIIWHGFNTDITERKQAEGALRDSEASLKRQNQLVSSLLENLTIGVFMVDSSTGKPLIINKMAEKLLGRGIFPDASTNNLSEVYNARKIGSSVPYPVEEMPIVRATYGESAHIDDMVVERPDGSEVLLEVSGTPVRDENGNIWASLISFSDITETKRSEAIREVQYNIARSIIKTERIEDLLEMIRHDLSKVLDVSNFIVALYNPKKDTLRKIIFKDENDDFSEWPAATSFSGFVVKLGETLFMNRQEIEIFARANNLETIGTPAACWIGVPIMIQNRVMGVIVTQSYTNTEAYSINDVALIEMVAHEISIYLDRKQMLDDLILAKEKAEESDQLKTAFINNVSHEIRTPLNGILGFGQFLADPELTEDERQAYFDKVQLSSNRLLDTVNDYMDMARIVSGTLTVIKKSFILKPSLNVLIDEFRMLCIAKNLDFELVISSDDEEIVVYSDKELVYRILRELLDNAIKFTISGKISMGYQVVADKIEFFVRDTGRGISAEKQSMIFDIFTQENASMTRGHEGSGLGLSIVKGMVGLLGGTVWVESEKGNGATFYFTLPYGIIPAQLQPMVPLSGKIPLSATKPLILVAEDDESNFMYLEVIIKKTGCDYIHVETGTEAVEVCRQNPHLTFVLMDIKMPDMNGLDATRLIREFRPDLPVIALTAYAQTGDGYRMLQAGCNEYFPKPVKPEVLKNLIKKYTQI